MHRQPSQAHFIWVTLVVMILLLRKLLQLQYTAFLQTLEQSFKCLQKYCSGKYHINLLLLENNEHRRISASRQKALATDTRSAYYDNDFHSLKMEFSLFLLCLSLGMRHGVDADHLAAIDSLSRVRPRPWNGVLFALGHGLVVTLLAVGAGALALPFPSQWSAWLLIGLGGVNLWRLLRPVPSAPLPVPAVGPLLLGVLFAAGFETASQLSALVLVRQTNPWLLGLAFSLGMVLVDGVDGFLAARVWSGGGRGTGAQVLGWTVVLFSFGLGGAELLGWELDSVALPLGVGLFALLVAVRLWGLRCSVQT